MKRMAGIVFSGWLAMTLVAPARAGEPPVVQGAPLGDEGIEVLGQQAVDLGAELPGMQDRQLRMRLMSIAPGGHTRVHSHRSRPAVFYVLQGATTVVYGDGTARRFTAGEMGSATRNTVHWHRNNGSRPVIFMAVDLFQRTAP